jgi:hypothetical protein
MRNRTPNQESVPTDEVTSPQSKNDQESVRSDFEESHHSKEFSSGLSQTSSALGRLIEYV